MPTTFPAVVGVLTKQLDVLRLLAAGSGMSPLIVNTKYEHDANLADHELSHHHEVPIRDEAHRWEHDWDCPTIPSLQRHRTGSVDSSASTDGHASPALPCNVPSVRQPLVRDAFPLLLARHEHGHNADILPLPQPLRATNKTTMQIRNASSSTLSSVHLDRFESRRPFVATLGNTEQVPVIFVQIAILGRQCVDLQFRHGLLQLDVQKIQGLVH